MMVVNTKTLDDYVEVINLAIYLGMGWSSGDKSIKTHPWEYYKTETCIVIRDKN